MRGRAFLLVSLFLIAASAFAQQSIYWKKDHLYGGQDLAEIGTATPLPSDQTAPSSPSGLSYSNVTSTSVKLTWTGSTDSGGSGLAGYKIYRGAIPVGTVATTSGTLTFLDQGLLPGTAYSYSVVAFDNAQNHSSASGSVTPSTPAGSLVSYWTADNTANDSVGSNHGTLQNGATYGTGQFGQSFSFDGINDYVSLQNANGSLGFGTGDFSIDLWAKFSALTGDQELFHKTSGTYPNDRVYMFEFSQGLRATCGYWFEIQLQTKTI